jgi:hypothetical protein
VLIVMGEGLGIVYKAYSTTSSRQLPSWNAGRVSTTGPATATAMAALAGGEIRLEDDGMR